MKGWRVSPQPQRSAADIAYADMMVEGLKEVRTGRPRVQVLDRSKMSAAEYDAAILAMQPASTRRCMTETSEEKSLRLSSLTSLTVEFASANKDAKSIEELVPIRDLTPEEIDVHRRAQHRSKNTLGQSGVSGASSERREAGANAFTYSKPAALAAPDKAALDKVLGYDKPPVVATAHEPTKAKPKWAWGFKTLLPWYWGHE